MGGIGSGLYERRRKPLIEQTNYLHINRLKNYGALTPGAAGTISWERAGECCCNVNYQCHEGYLELNFRHSQAQGSWNALQQHIALERTACPYGGYRPWFSCPVCSRRVGILSGYQGLFKCRHCYGLKYSSQYKHPVERLIAKQHKLGERIFDLYEYGEGFGKKKGMHWRTFQSLHEQYQQLGEAVDSRLAAAGLS